ncbi:hypothetical protein K432DRAFT_383435 [Lepidopterella palustris CBS 459.81]|uniref:Uncharacterized protein n=1 Tax=Lepidopterella palustris CBS 459.81 TaxID=1314670 RepID=A0A8E2JE16_9PEZI|nr:hypothetical protein K432DRAFT_383435 [Lepidopterella palustris CBS 459.81]
MPAPLAKGPHVRPSSPHSHKDFPRRPNLPFQTGLIIAASVLVAAGIAIYESPQVRLWVDQSRRKIAVALHSLGDEIQPRQSSSSSSDNGLREEEARGRRREDIIRRNRAELIRKAREEGIAVDLDELARINREGAELEMGEFNNRNTRNHTKSFDNLVGSDGMLRDNHPLIKTEDETTTATTVTAMDSSVMDGDGGLRRRGQTSQGFDRGVVLANPFSDEAHVLFDHDLIRPEEHEIPTTSTATITLESRDSLATQEGDHQRSEASQNQLIDLSTEDPPINIPQHQELPQTASIHSVASSWHADENPIIQDQDEASQSFHSFTTSSSLSTLSNLPRSNPHIFANTDEEADEVMSTGTATPTEDGFSTAASMVGSHADDIAVLSMTHDDDPRSETFSEGGFTEAGFSEAGFSELGEGDRTGAQTPNSWTDVGSESGSEYGTAHASHQQ